MRARRFFKRLYLFGSLFDKSPSRQCVDYDENFLRLREQWRTVKQEDDFLYLVLN